MMNRPMQGSNTQPTLNKRTEAIGGEGGYLFEMNMAAVIGLRGMKKGHEFELSSNAKEAGNFDDLVYTTDDRQCYLELKHSYDADKNLKKSDLEKILKNGVISYCKIKEDKSLKNNPTDNMEFIIYTNKKLHPNVSWCTTDYTKNDIFFKTCDNELFTFSRDITGNGNDVHTYLENLVKKRKYDKDLGYPGEIKFLDMMNEFLNKLIMVTGQEANQELDALIAKEIINMHEIELDDKIELDHKIKLDDKEYKSILYHFKTPLGAWWRSTKKENMTPKILRNWLERAKTEHFTPFVVGMINSCTKKLDGTGINFSDSEVLRLQDELSNKSAVHLRSDAPTLCSKLLLECLPQSKYIFVTFESLQNNTDMLLYAWLGGYWEWLVVFCDSTVLHSDLSDTCLKISYIIQCAPPTKHIIILTAFSVQPIRDFVPKEHKFNFELLSKKSQDIVLEKKIDFQGWEVTLRSVLQRHDDVKHVLGPELVTDMITKETIVNIGGRLQENKEHYEPRVFKRKIWLSLDILRNRSTYHDMFAVSGMQENDLVDIVPSGEEIASFRFEEGYGNEHYTKNYDFLEKRFIVLKGRNMKSSFLKLCEIHSTKTLHWLKYKDGKLYWKQTRGEFQNLLSFIEGDKTPADQRIVRNCMKSGSCEVKEQEIWNVGEKTVPVVAEPGMGKSSTTTQVAWCTKKQDPTSWVVRINWNDNTKKLQEIDAEQFNFDSLVEFLCSAAFPESTYADISRNLLHQALQNNGNVTVLMDGFDEINPNHADKAAVILSELMETKVERVWVTSRPVQRERLEKKLSVNAFSMKKLSHGSQEKVLMGIWKEKGNGDIEECLNIYVKNLLLQANNSVHQRNFTGCPLYIMMIASAFENNLETFLETREINLPNKFDLLELYDTFITRKLQIYQTQKERVDLTNASLQDDHEFWKEIYLEHLEKCSLSVTLPSELILLSEEEVQTKIRSFIERFQAGKDKIGIVMSVVEDRLHFVHRTFAEYLTARWFSKNFESDKTLLEMILFKPEYGIVKDVFDRLLAKGFPLHCAVLDRNTEVVEMLLQGGNDVNAVDGGGRTAMHLIAAQGPGDHLCEEITSSLLGYGAFVNVEDNVLKWTALHYAVETQNWLVVERLLEKQCNTTGLQLISLRLDDEFYIGNIIDDIKDENCSLLLQYLDNICANTKWAPLVEAAVGLI